MNNDDLTYMKEALADAKRAGDADDIPVGAIIVKDGEISQWEGWLLLIFYVLFIGNLFNLI